MSLKKLIARCKKKDIKAQEKLYELYSGRLFTLCLKYSSDYQQAQDNFQDGFVKIFESIDRFEGRGSFEGWMTRIMINTSLKKYKRQAFFLSIDEERTEDPQIEIDLEDSSLSVDILINMVQELPEGYRHIFNLFAMEGYSHQEIAEMLNISVGTSKSNLSRARKILKRKIEHYLEQKSARSI